MTWGWPDWTNVCPLGHCLLYVVLWKLQKISQNVGKLYICIHGKSYAYILTKMFLFYFLCYFFTNLSDHPGQGLRTRLHRNILVEKSNMCSILFGPIFPWPITLCGRTMYVCTYIAAKPQKLWMVITIDWEKCSILFRSRNSRRQNSN
jgi:hypothetical protein